MKEVKEAYVGEVIGVKLKLIWHVVREKIQDLFEYPWAVENLVENLCKEKLSESRERRKINEWILMNNGWHCEQEENFSHFGAFFGFLHSNEKETMEKFSMFTSHEVGLNVEQTLIVF